MRTLIAARQISTLARRLCAAAVLAAAMTTAGAALAADIHVFTFGAPAEVEKVLAGQFARETGHHVVFTVAPPATIRQKLAAGETPDVIVLPAPAIDALEKAGALRPGSRVDLRGSASRRCSDGARIFRRSRRQKLLADARSIVIGTDWRGRRRAPRMPRSSASPMGRQLTLMQAIAGGSRWSPRQAEVGMLTLKSCRSGARLVGPLPSELQSYITCGGDGKNAAPAPAQAFIKSLPVPSARAMESRRRIIGRQGKTLVRASRRTRRCRGQPVGKFHADARP
jgi:hypothetical protein